MKNESDNILEQASELYHKHGIRSITMDDLASELGMSKKTIYKYFSSKNKLVSKVVEMEGKLHEKKFMEVLKNCKNALEEMIEMSKLTCQMLKNCNPNFEFELKRHYPKIHKNVLVQKQMRILNWVIDNIRKGKKEGFYRKDLNEEMNGKLHVAMFEHSLQIRLFSLNEVLSNQFFFDLFNYHIRGIANPKGIAMWEKYLKENNLQK